MSGVDPALVALSRSRRVDETIRKKITPRDNVYPFLILTERRGWAGGVGGYELGRAPNTFLFLSFYFLPLDFDYVSTFMSASLRLFNCHHFSFFPIFLFP